MTMSAKKFPSVKQPQKTKASHLPSVAKKATRLPGTKSSKILQLLGRDIGATVNELAHATNWQVHSVRGFMSGTVKKKLALNITSEIVNGVRHYRIIGNGAGQ